MIKKALRGGFPQRLECLIQSIYLAIYSGASAASPAMVRVKATLFSAEILGLLRIAALCQLIQIVHENMRNVKVPRVQTADKAAQERITAVCVILDIDQTDLMVDVETKGVSFFDAHNAAGFALHCLVEGADELLRLAGAFGTHHNIDHTGIPPFLMWSASLYQLSAGNTRTYL